MIVSHEMIDPNINYILNLLQKYKDKLIILQTEKIILKIYIYKQVIRFTCTFKLTRIRPYTLGSSSIKSYNSCIVV